MGRGGGRGGLKKKRVSQTEICLREDGFGRRGGEGGNGWIVRWWVVCSIRGRRSVNVVCGVLVCSDEMQRCINITRLLKRDDYVIRGQWKWSTG